MYLCDHEQWSDLHLQSEGVCSAPITYAFFPNTATITFYPNKWASFSIPPDGGYTTAATFTRQLDLTKGLYLEVYYCDIINEKYKIMEIKVFKNS